MVNLYKGVIMKQNNLRKLMIDNAINCLNAEYNNHTNRVDLIKEIQNIKLSDTTFLAKYNYILRNYYIVK